MKIYPYLSYRRETETKQTYLQFAEGMGQLWLAEWKLLLTDLQFQWSAEIF